MHNRTLCWRHRSHRCGQRRSWTRVYYEHSYRFLVPEKTKVVMLTAKRVFQRPRIMVNAHEIDIKKKVKIPRDWVRYETQIRNSHNKGGEKGYNDCHSTWQANAESKWPNMCHEKIVIYCCEQHYAVRLFDMERSRKDRELSVTNSMSSEEDQSMNR